MELLDLVLWFLEEYTEELGAGAVIAGGGAWLMRKFKKDKGTELSDKTIEQIKPITPVETAALTVPQFIAIRREMKDDLLKELAEAEDTEKAELQTRIAELESQIADPEPALIDAQKTIAELTTRLEPMGNDIGGDRLAEAQAALAKLDFSVADDIFAEVEARHQMEVQQAARAAFGRGEVAEAEIRWHDAAEHYGRAARFDPSFDTLYRSRLFSWRAGDYQLAFRTGEDLLMIARTGSDEHLLSIALNEHALTVKYLGEYGKAETLHREALSIDEKTIGTAHPDYAIHLNNLAGVVQAQGRYEEAETLYREALAIDEKTIGTAHPEYAKHLNNLALVVKAQGRYDEAETLYREALAIGEKTIGTAHPDYATRLNNLALVVQEQGRYDEAETLYREALAIDEKTIGTAHPQYANHLNNLALVVKAQGRYEEAEALFSQAIQIALNSLGAEHPNTKTFQANLNKLLSEKR